MAEATTEVVRTRRIEVVDDKGQVRLVLGLLGRGGDDVFGLAVRDDRGRDRAWVIHDGPCAEVGLDHGGNTVAALTVADDGTAGVYLAD